MRKKLLLMSLLLSLSFISCDKNNDSKDTKTSIESKESIESSVEKQSSESKESILSSEIESSINEKTSLNLDNIYLSNLSMGGVLNDIDDFTKYENTSYYKKVSTAREFLNAINSSRLSYETTVSSDGIINQVLNNESETHVIELTSDLDLGFNVLDNLGLVDEGGIVSNWFTNNTDMFVDPYISEKGISQIKIENISNLLIYSKNGSKIKHAGFKVNSCYNVAIRNIEFDEMWMWEDSPSASPSKTIGDYDTQGWAYFKIGYSENIWIDHCTFGKSFDGQIDISNANSKKLPSRIPYGSKCEGGGVHISYCDFQTGYDNDGNVKEYIKNECDNIEAEYQKYIKDKTTYSFDSPYSCRYYFTARDLGASYENMLYGVFVPQKKGFLLGDTGNTYTQEVVLTNDTIFDSTKTYYKINGFEANGRMKFKKGEGYTYGNSVADTTYTYKDTSGNTVTSNTWYEGLNIVGNDYYYNLDLKISFSSCKFIDIEDRLPNMRGGICYMYNSLIDCSNYFTQRQQILALKDKMKTANSRYKMALVTQGIISCFNASVYYDNVKVLGVEQALKNNNILFEGLYDKDGNPLDQYDLSGYMIKDCYFLKNPDDTTAKICGSTSYDKTTDTVVDPFSSFNSTKAVLSPKYFDYHNEKNELDFEIIGFSEYYLPISKNKDNPKYLATPSLCLTSLEKVYFKELDAGITSELFDNFFLYNTYK